MRLAEAYVKQIYKGLRYWAVWSPGVHIELGDCGPLSDFIFHREGNVRDYGISFGVHSGVTHETWSYTTENAVNWTVQAAADAQKIPEVPAGQAAIGVDFTKGNSIIFVAPSGTQSSVADITELKRQVVARALDHGSPDLFPTDFAVVTDVVTVDSVTVLVSRARRGRFVASASGDFAVGLVSLGDAKLGVNHLSSTSVTTHLLAKENATPLFRGFKLRRNWWGKVETAWARGCAARGGLRSLR